jgi:ABC-type ATPase with predicted acetyltransferase domain
LEKKVVIAKCVRCGRLLLAKAIAKTKTCPYCNIRFSLDTATIVGHSDSSDEAKVMLSELKKREAERQKRPVKQRKLESESF